MNKIEIKTVRSKKDMTAFIKFPWSIYKDDPCWVPPLIMDRKKLFNRNKNPFFRHAEMELFLAYSNGKIVGRIAAITNENHNKFHNDNLGFFGFFESINDPNVSNLLLNRVKTWLKERGKEGMIGPMNPSTNDEAGLLIDGFNTPPFVLMCHNPKYYQELLENYGLIKAKDLYAWYIDADKVTITEKMARVSSKICESTGLILRNIKLKNLKSELKLIKEIYNNAWSRNWGFVPLTNEEINHIAADLKQIADEDLLLLAEKNGTPIGFSVTIPNINEILIKMPSGKLFPTGFFKLMTGIKKVRSVRVILLGIVKEYQSQGIGSLFYIETFKRAVNKGIKNGEMSWILEDNYTMNRAIESFGSKLYKTYRIYQQNF
jgi:GNAT superfamily N-acetyltransferase